MLSLNRASIWEQSLSDYISSKREDPFVYGKNDCCMFVAGAVEAMTGIDPMSEFRGQYKSLATSVRALKEIGAGDLEKTIDGKFPVIPVSSAKRGDIAFYENALGIVMDGYAWFVSDDGLERIPRSEWIKCWGVGNG